MNKNLKLNNKLKIICMIPARKGSVRLKDKNLVLIKGKPLIYYSIMNAIETGIFDQIILNSDSAIYKKIADKYGIEFYKRPKLLATSNTKSDDVVLDFLKKYNCDIIVWLNPISPLQKKNEIVKVIEYFKSQKLNSLITTSLKQVHVTYKNKPLNFSIKNKFERTQDLEPINEMVYSIMMWTSKSFIKSMNKKKHAIIHGKFGTFNVNKLSSVIVKTEDDIWMIESLLNKMNNENKKILYDPILYK